MSSSSESCWEVEHSACTNYLTSEATLNPVSAEFTFEEIETQIGSVTGVKVMAANL